MNSIEYLRRSARYHMDKEFDRIAEEMENLIKTNRQMYLDMRASNMFVMTEEQWFDKYGYFNINP